MPALLKPSAPACRVQVSLRETGGSGNNKGSMFAPAPPLLEAWKTAVTAGSGAPTALLLEPDSKTGSVACAATFAEGSDDPAAPWGFIASHAEKGAAPLLFLINEGASKWRFVSFVPEGTHPAKKMAYANARSSLRPLLGKDAVDFQPDYHVTDKEELTLGAMREWADRSDREVRRGRVAACEGVGERGGRARRNNLVGRGVHCSSTAPAALHHYATPVIFHVPIVFSPRIPAGCHVYLGEGEGGGHPQ